jgi:hypothetical protein
MEKISSVMEMATVNVKHVKGKYAGTGFTLQ